MAEKPVAVVTGGASGIGEATARRLAADGYAIAIVDMNKARGEEVAASISTGGTAAKFFVCDVANAAEVERVAADVEKQLGPARTLVTSAALIPNTEGIMDMDMAAHERMWQVNYHGTIHTCRAFGRQMIARKQGAIVTLGSINSYLSSAPTSHCLQDRLARRKSREVETGVAPVLPLKPSLSSSRKPRKNSFSLS
jgi:NAD(P)-dependent dehydrogenase (short-subunit alcohol dehydrogenase family)